MLPTSRRLAEAYRLTMDAPSSAWASGSHRYSMLVNDAWSGIERQGAGRIRASSAETLLEQL